MSQQDGNWNVYLAELESGALTALTNHLAKDTAPLWSPDGAWISFFSERTGTSELYRMYPDGSGIQQWTYNHARDWHVWSPDGSRIAFVAGENDEEDLFVLDVQTGVVTPLVIRPGRDVAPAWSPDSQRLVFASDQDGDLELYLISVPH
jgi:TolB protein